MILYNNSYHGYEVYYDQHGSGLDEEIVKKIFVLLKYATTVHSHVRFIRFDVRFPWYVADHQVDPILADFRNHFINEIWKNYGPAYYIRSWEQEDSDLPHFHFVLLVCDAPNLKYKKEILDLADRLFALKVSSYTGEYAKDRIYKCLTDKRGRKQKNGIIIKENHGISDINFRECFRWATYLAKNHTKEKIPKRTRRFTMSQLPKWVWQRDWFAEPKMTVLPMVDLSELGNADLNCHLTELLHV
jgi:hypothetical protein